MSEPAMETSLKEIFQSSIRRLEDQIRADPMRAISNGFSFGAGLTALNADSLREGAIEFAKLITFEVLKEVRLPNVQHSKEAS